MLEVLYSTFVRKWTNKIQLGSSSFATSTSMELGRRDQVEQVCQHSRGSWSQHSPCDLYNEHINKEIIANLGSNLTDAAIQRIARAVTTLHHIRTNFDKVSGVPVLTRAHSTRPDDNHVARVVPRERLLHVTPGRRHSSQILPVGQCDQHDHSLANSHLV